MRVLALILFVLLPALSWAEPAPVFARVASRPEGAPSTLSLRQDRCYSWAQPTVTVANQAVAVTQAVTPIPNCTATGSDNANIALGQFAVGTYRLTYTPVPVGFGPMPVSVLEFNVRPYGGGRRLDVEPVQPVALEPVQVHFFIEDTCEWVSGFRATTDSFRIELAADQSNPFACDGILETSITIGAFPPGTYRVELVRPDSHGGEVLASANFEVQPGIPAYPSSRPTPTPDQSGFWTSPNEEPRTGMTLIQSRVPENPGVTPPTEAIAGIWYRYRADGTPEWLWVDAAAGLSFLRTFTGTVTRYASTNEAAPAWQRTIAGTPAGTITIQFGNADQPARVAAVVDGEELDFSLQRFRWQRSGWPEVK